MDEPGCRLPKRRRANWRPRQRPFGCGLSRYRARRCMMAEPFGADEEELPEDGR
jgi:hypothetical protein